MNGQNYQKINKTKPTPLISNTVASAAALPFIRLLSKDGISVSPASRPSCLCFHLTHSARETHTECLMPLFFYLFLVFLSEQPSIKEDPGQQKKENHSKSSQRDAHQSHWTISHTV